jgi:hypothetical protein
MKSSTLILLGAFLLLYAQANGQQELSQFQQIIRDFQKIKVLNMDIEAIGYETKGGKGKTVMKGTMKLNGNKYYSKSDEMEMLVLGTEMIAVDHEAKEVSIARSKSISDLKAEQVIFQLDSLVAKGGKLSFLGNKDGLRLYSIKMPKSVITELQVGVNENNLVALVTYFFQSMPDLESVYQKVEVKFTNISRTPAPDSFFDEKIFFANRKTKKLAPSLKGYEVNEVDYSMPDLGF